MATQRLGIHAGEFFFADREGNDRDVFSLDALVAEFLVKGTLASPLTVETTAVFLPSRSEFLDRGDFRLPVGEAERGVVDLMSSSFTPLEIR